MRLHVIPIRDVRGGKRFDHAASSRCECQPFEDTIRRNKLYIHHAFDLREKWERQDAYHEHPGWVTIEEL